MDTILRHLQLTELDILKTVHKFCVQHGIKYSLYAGTLLGAVRHKGFIPWDDDIDICMARTEYDRFIDLWEQDPPRGYTLQNKDNTPAFTQSFTKIRKDHTTFLQSERERGKYHNGIFLDVFPLDRIPSAWFPKRVFYLRCMLYQLMVREYEPPKSNAIIRFVCKFLLAVLRGNSRGILEQKLLKKLTKQNDTREFKTVCFATMSAVKIEFPCNLTENTIQMPFEDEVFQAFSLWDTMLSSGYGDYMQLPPEEERTWKHHPILLDFEKDLNEIESLNGCEC